MDRRLFRECNTPEEKERLKESLKHNKWMLDLIVSIMEDELKGLSKLRLQTEPDFGKYIAFVERERAARKLIRLLSLKEPEKKEVDNA